MTDLDWPEGFERTPESEREPYPYGFTVSRSDAFDNILQELRRMDGVRDVQLESGAEHQVRNPNKPYADADFGDPGVVVYFERDGQQYAVPCDRWDNPRDNAQAIAKYLNAKRGLERWGVETVSSEFETQALPTAEGGATPAEEPPHEVLGIDPDASDAVVKGAARALKKRHHPDQGGDQELFKAIVEAEQAMLEERGDAP